MINPDFYSKLKESDRSFYVLAVDVGRLSCQTVVTVFKVKPGDDCFRASLSNIIILGKTEQSKHFSIQALDLKKIIQLYCPSDVVIDGNGLGIGLTDYMVKESIDPDTGIIYPGYSFKNDDSYRKIEDPCGKKILYMMKANGTTNPKINSNCFTMIHSGRISFLAPEREVKNRMLGTVRGAKMSLEKRAERLMPHELTTRLFEEMVNLKIKPSGSATDINIEQINRNIGKDKYSSLSYGLWRIKELESEYIQNVNKRRKYSGQSLMFYTQGG